MKFISWSEEEQGMTMLSGNSSPLPTTSQDGPNSIVDSPLTLDSPLDGQWTNDDHQGDLAQARVNELRSLNKQLLASEKLVDKLRFEDETDTVGFWATKHVQKRTIAGSGRRRRTSVGVMSKFLLVPMLPGYL
uniref:Uncharacterized protein n=1 Tax=Trichuris muris TaxID=70415 RepID=A0A5S6QLP6_TRIMR